jgi:hypothetical protein
MRRRVAVALALAAATVGGAIPHAAAHNMANYYQLGYSLRYNHTICEADCNVVNGNITGVWQTFVYLDGRGPHTSSCEIDGRFGPNTSTNTAIWQFEEDLFADGVVGESTWWAVENDRWGLWDNTSTYRRYYYDGELRGIRNWWKYDKTAGSTWPGKQWDTTDDMWRNTGHPPTHEISINYCDDL